MLYVLHTFTHAAARQEYSECFEAADEGEIIAAIDASCMGMGGIWGALDMDPNRRRKPTLKQALKAHGKRVRVFRDEDEAIAYAMPPWADDTRRREAAAILDVLPNYASEIFGTARTPIEDQQDALREALGPDRRKLSDEEILGNFGLIAADLSKHHPRGDDPAFIDGAAAAARIATMLLRTTFTHWEAMNLAHEKEQKS